MVGLALVLVTFRNVLNSKRRRRMCVTLFGFHHVFVTSRWKRFRHVWTRLPDGEWFTGLSRADFSESVALVGTKDISRSA